MKFSPPSPLSKWLRWPVATLRTYLILVIIVATVPLGVLTSWLMSQEIVAARQQLSNGLLRAAGSLALMVEREQVSSLDALTILSHSDALRSMDLAAFHRTLSRLSEIRPSWSRVFLVDMQGNILLSNDRPMGAKGVDAVAGPNVRAVLSSTESQVASMTKSSRTGRWVTRISVPVRIRDELRYRLVAEIDAQAWQKLIAGVNPPSDGFVTVFDGDHRIVARSLHPERFIGTMLPPLNRQRMVGNPSGFYKVHLMEGGETYAAWQRIGLSGWGVGVGVSAAPLDRDNLKAISAAVMAGLVSLLTGLGLSLVVVRRVNEPLKALATGGAVAVQGEIAVREIGLLRDAMREAEQQREQARERLEAKATEFETLFNTSPIGLSMTQDPSGKDVLRNPAKIAMFNLEPDQPRTFVLSEDGRELPFDRHPLQRAARGETVWNQELEVRHEDGRVLKLLAHAVPLLDAHGRPRGGIATFVDITERVLAQERLQRAQSRLQDSQHLVELAQEAGDVGFFDHVVDSDTVTMTSGLARLFGLERQAVETSWAGWIRRVNTDDAQALKTLLTQAWREGQAHVTFKFRTLGENAAMRWLSSRMVIMYDSGGRPVRMIGVMVDVTAQQLVEQERAHLIAQEQKARLDAENANRSKDEFLAMLGHELRNPLSAISAAIEVLNRIPSQGDQAVRVRMIITRQTRHLARLMDDLLDVARVIAGKIHLSLQPVNLGATVQRLVNTMKMAGLVGQHVVETEVRDAWIQADAMRLEQIVNNLVTNAVKYSPADARIKVIVRHDGLHARLQVIDRGVGIPDHLLPRIFDLFVQGERTLDRRQGGLGIGLTLVKSLVELHDGAISVASSSEGSTFTVEMPMIEAPHDADSDLPITESSRRDVVVVEDNPDAREALCYMLELKGHTVQTAPDGHAGLERILAVRPHLALVDIGLPELNGYEVAREARAKGFTGWMIAVSGYGQPRDVQSALECGFDAHMVKPIDESVLEDYLNRAPRPETACSD
jgi:PAS domain S-box-containing protein